MRIVEIDWTVNQIRVTWESGPYHSVKRQSRLFDSLVDAYAFASKKAGKMGIVIDHTGEARGSY